jgi:hypothetical protein
MKKGKLKAVFIDDVSCGLPRPTLTNRNKAREIPNKATISDDLVDVGDRRRQLVQGLQRWDIFSCRTLIVRMRVMATVTPRLRIPFPATLSTLKSTSTVSAA